MAHRIETHNLSVERGDKPSAAYATRFDRVRSAHSTELLEDYTELIDDLIRECGEARTTDIARCMGVALPTTIKSLARLKREGLVTAHPYRSVFLTEAGSAMAERVRTRHRLVVNLLTAVGVPPASAEIDAEGIEHHVSEATLAAFKQFLGEFGDGRQTRGSVC